MEVGPFSRLALDAEPIPSPPVPPPPEAHRESNGRTFGTDVTGDCRRALGDFTGDSRGREDITGDSRRALGRIQWGRKVIGMRWNSPSNTDHTAAWWYLGTTLLCFVDLCFVVFLTYISLHYTVC